MITTRTYAQAMAVLKHPDMAQALYDAGSAVMQDALITLHGQRHRQRRVVEFGVFTRKFFRTYAQQTFPAAFEPVFAQALAAGRVDLIDLGYRVTMNLTADFAGIDRTDSAEDTAALLRLVKIFSRGATLVHATTDAAAVNAAVEAAMAEFEQRFVQPSLARRQRLLQAGQDLPHDVLSTLVRKAASVDMSRDQLRREMAFYLQAGAHSTANSTVRAIHDCLGFWGGDTARRQAELADARLIQRYVHESLRLHPASPVARRRATTTVAVDQWQLAPDDVIEVDLIAANTDTSVFGSDARQFNPARKLPPAIWPFGLSFGYGPHACMGRDLDGGVASDADSAASHQLGLVPTMVQRILGAGARLIDGQPPTADAATLRDNFATYPVCFDAGLAI